MPLLPRSARRMIGWRPPSSLGNFACRLRKEDIASVSLFCEDSCTTKPGDVLSVAGAAAVCVRPLAAGAGGVGAGRCDALGAAAGEPCGAAGAGMPTGLPLTSLPSGRMVTVRIFLGSVDGRPAPLDGDCAGAACTAADGGGGTMRGADAGADS